MPTKHRRHSITETPRVKLALDGLREHTGEDSLDLAELLVLGARTETSRLVAERQSRLIAPSAWTRVARLGDTGRSQFVAALRLRSIMASLPLALGLENARDPSIARLPWLPIDDEVERAARLAQSELRGDGGADIPPLALLLAALAHRHATGVLHYDAVFDDILGRTGLRFGSAWIAPAGSLD